MRIKLLFLLLITCSMSVNAQNDERALAAAVDTIVRKYTEADIVNQFVDEIFEKHRSAYLATRIAKSYYNYNEESDIYKDQFHKMRSYHKNDTAMAFKYINRAIAVDPHFGRSYVIACDILDYYGQTEEGMKWLERGLIYCPKDSSLYIAQAEILARTDIEAAKSKLEDLRKMDPSVPIDLYIARIYDKMDIKGNEYRAQVAEHYAKIDKSQMTQSDLETFVMSLFYSGQNEECNTQAEEGLKYYPRSLALNRFFFRSLIPLKKYSEAITAFASLKASENSVIEIRDSVNYAAALAGTKKYDAAMALYDIILANPALSDNDRKSTEYYVGQCMSARVKDFTDMGEYQQAIDMYSAFIEKRRAQGLLDDMMNYTLANIYIDWADELNGQEKEATLMKADRILEEAVNNIKIKSNAVTLAGIRVFRIYFQIDPNAQTGAGIPAINTYESLVMADGGLPTGTNASRLVMAYRYMMSYYAFVKTDYKTASAYAEKILDIDPLNENAMKLIEAMSKSGHKRR